LRPRRAWIYLSVFIILLIAAFVALRGLGRWLVREDPISSADIIVVLSGGMPYRAEGAAALFQRGSAGEVWVTRPENYAVELAKLGIRFVGEEEYTSQILIHEGVPEKELKILPDTVLNTEQEVEEIARQMRRTGKSRALIVTSPQHTRRVHTLWERLVGENPKVIVRATPADPFDAEHWWRNTRDASAVAHEALGLLNVWAGLPVRPPSE